MILPAARSITVIVAPIGQLTLVLLAMVNARLDADVE